MAEFEQMLRAVFQGAAKYIRLKLINDGSVIAVCECPAFIVGSLTVLVRERQELLCSYGVLKVTIENTVIMKKKPKVLMPL